MTRIDDAVAAVTRVVDERLIPLEKDFLAKGFLAVLPDLNEIRGEVKRLGLWAPYLPVDLSGMGLGLAEYARVSEALGRSLLGHYAFHCQAPDVGNLELLIAHGSAEQKRDYLEPLARGAIRSCFGMTEPDYPGSNPVWMNTRAELDGDHWVISGRKWFTTGADGAAFCIVMAITEPEAAPIHSRASQIIVPCNTPGFRLVRNVSVMGEPGGGHASHAEIEFDRTRVAIKNLLGPRGAGFGLAQERLGPGRIHHCMRWIGICERALSLMVERAAQRQLSPGKPLGTQQQVQFWIAESQVEIHAARLLVLDCAERIERDGTRGARDYVSMIKFHVAKVLGDVLDRALQVHGALGMSDDTPIAYWYRHERAARIYDGPDEVHKASVAKRALEKAGMKSKT